MSSTEEVKRPKSNVSRLVSPTTMGGKKVFTNIAKDPWDIIQGYTEKEGPKTNFSNKNLRGAKYEDYDLHNSNFDGCDLTGATFTNCNLSGCSFKNAIMDGINLDDSLMKGARLKNASLVGARMRNVNMLDCNLSYTVFDGADLSYSILDGATVNNTSFKGTILRSTNMFFRKTPIDYTDETIAIFERADLTAAKLFIDGIIKIKDAILIGSEIQEVKIVDEELKNMDFSSSTLLGVELTGVNLTNIRFNFSKLSKVYFRKSKLESVYFNNLSEDEDLDADDPRIAFIDSELNRCSFNYLSGIPIDLRESTLLNCSFSGSPYPNNAAVYLNINFSHKKSNLMGCDFKSCSLTFLANKSKNGSKPILEGCNFNMVVFAKVKNVTLKNCHFTRSRFQDELVGSEIEECSFLESKFKNLLINWSTLTNNNFRFVRFLSVNIYDSSIVDNTFEGETNFLNFNVGRSKFINKEYLIENPKNDKISFSESEVGPQDSEFFRNKNVKRSNTLSKKMLPSSSEEEKQARKYRSASPKSKSSSSDSKSKKDLAKQGGSPQPDSSSEDEVVIRPRRKSSSS